MYDPMVAKSALKGNERELWPARGRIPLDQSHDVCHDCQDGHAPWDREQSELPGGRASFVVAPRRSAAPSGPSASTPLSGEWIPGVLSPTRRCCGAWGDNARFCWSVESAVRGRTPGVSRAEGGTDRKIVARGHGRAHPCEYACVVTGGGRGRLDDNRLHQWHLPRGTV